MLMPMLIPRCRSQNFQMANVLLGSIRPAHNFVLRCEACYAYKSYLPLEPCESL